MGPTKQENRKIIDSNLPWEKDMLNSQEGIFLAWCEFVSGDFLYQITIIPSIFGKNHWHTKVAYFWFPKKVGTLFFGQHKKMSWPGGLGLGLHSSAKAPEVSSQFAQKNIAKGPQKVQAFWSSFAIIVQGQTRC